MERRFVAETAVLILGVLFPFFAGALVTGCGSSETVQDTAPEESYRYAHSIPMSERAVETVTKDLRVLCPRGWKETVDQKNAPNIVLWLVRDDYTASISFVPMQMNPALYSVLKKDGLMSVAKISLSMKKDNARDTVVVLQPPERFRIHDREFVAYEYTVRPGAAIIRVVVFDTGRQYMECALLPATVGISAEESRILFESQQSVLASMSVR